MSDESLKNDINLTDEYAQIFASVYGQGQEAVPDLVEEDKAPVQDQNFDWESLYSFPERKHAFESTTTDETDSENSYASHASSQEYDYDAPPDARYNLEQDDYWDENASDEDDGEDFPNSFKDYLGAKLTGTLFRIRGSVPASSSTSTMEDSDDDVLGREVSPRYAEKYYGACLASIKQRVFLGLGIILIMMYLSLNLPSAGALKSLTGKAISVTALQIALMIVCLDVFTTGILNMFSGKLGADSLASISCIVTLLDALSIQYSSFAEPHLPLCLISSLSLYGVLCSSFLSARAIKRTVRVPSIGKKMYCVTCEENIIGHELTILKSTRSISGFVRRIEEEPIDELCYKKASIFILIFSAALTAVTVILKNNLSNILFIFSAIFCPAVPFSALMCFSLPYFVGAGRIFGQGAAIAGWSGAYDLGHSKNLIVTDRDIFPDGTVEIEDVRIFANYDSKKVISYACSLVRESESALTNAFARLLDENGCSYCNVDSLEILQGGGFKGLIEGHVVICGSTDLMRLLDVKLPFRLLSQRSVLLSIDGVLYGIFNIKYSPSEDVRKALVSLMRSNRHPVFAVRDFNITPDMIKEIYDVATDGYDFPPYQDRFNISEAKPAKQSQVSSVVCREGLGPLTAMADTARSIFVISKINSVLSVVCSFVASILFFYLIFTGKEVNAAKELLYSVLSSLPVLILGIITNFPF